MTKPKISYNAQKNTKRLTDFETTPEEEQKDECEPEKKE